MACILTFALLALDGPSRPERIASAAGALGPVSHQKSKKCVTKRALPSLHYLGIVATPLGDEGLALLLSNLRQLPNLGMLHLMNANIGDESVASLVAQPTAGALRFLKVLFLDYNQITDAGCATLASALRGGALPALERLDVQNNPASEVAKEAVLGSRSGLVEEE